MLMYFVKTLKPFNSLSAPLKSKSETSEIQNPNNYEREEETAMNIMEARTVMSKIKAIWQLIKR